MIRRVDTFPEIMEGEALFSAVAHYHLWSGNSSQAQSHQDLFGHPAVRASVDLPLFIRQLVERLPAGTTLDEWDLASRHTLLPYFTAFMPAKDAEEAMERMLAGNQRLHAFIGAMASVVTRPVHLRFCGTCLEEMRRRAGRYWWRLEHQLSGVFLCLDHGEVLKESSVLYNSQLPTFVAASDETCPSDAAPVIDRASPDIMEQLLDIAVRSARLLGSTPRFESYEDITRYYRGALDDVGLMNIGKQLDVAKFEVAWRKFYYNLEHFLTPVLVITGERDAWVFEMARRYKYRKHPLQHIVFQMFLDAQPRRIRPFGDGPWACPNPMAEHGKGAYSITRVKEHNRHGSVVGTFSCDCGYAYTMTRDPDGTLRGPRYRQFGPLLEPSVIRLVNDGATLRGAADALGIHHRVVAETAERLGLAKNWKPPERRRKPSNRDADQPVGGAAIEKSPVVRNISQARIDWDSLDGEIVLEVDAAVAEIKAASPVMRVSIKEIERVCGRGESWIYLRRQKLPLAMARIKKHLETLTEFQERRLRDIIRRNLDSGKLFSVSSVIRESSLKYDVWSDLARQLIHEMNVSDRLS